MKPIKTKTTNVILKPPNGKEGEVFDLPASLFKFNNGIDGVESCWELNDDEVNDIIKNKKIYFICVGKTHPPIILKTDSILRKESDESE